MSSFAEAVALQKGWLAKLRRVLLGNSLLDHNGKKVTEYNEESYFLVPFPESKGVPYVADNLATANISSFRFESGFAEAREAAESRWPEKKGERGGRLDRRDISWRLHVAIFAARLGMQKANSGDAFVELGTGRGFMAAGILNAIGPQRFAEKGISFYLMDSFQPYWQGENLTAWKEGTIAASEGRFPWYYADGSKELREYFSSFPNVEVIEGVLPMSLSETGDSNIAFLHVDLNSASAEESCLMQVRTRLKPGSVLLFDDSTNPGCEDQLRVHRRFAESLGSYLMELPTGQSIVVCD